MSLGQNNWRLIREFYSVVNREIMTEKSNEWGIDPYAWDHGIIDMTPIERWLWADIRHADAVFYPQYPVGKFFVDFANPKAKVAIECDGHDYHLDKQKDAIRDKQLQALGWTVYRITGVDCRKDFNEETREKSPGAALLDRICKWHHVARSQ